MERYADKRCRRVSNSADAVAKTTRKTRGFEFMNIKTAKMRYRKTAVHQT